MNKRDLINSIAEKANLTKVDAAKALDATMESVVEAMKAEDKVALIGFGTFSVQHKPERIGRNPLTKAQITIPAKKVVKFKPGSDLTL